METANYHSKAKALLDYLTSQGYSKKYVSQFRLECERVAERLPLYGSFEQYIAEYPASFGLTMYKTRLTVIRLIRSYFEDGHLPSRRNRVRQKATSYEQLPDGVRILVDLYESDRGRFWSVSTSVSVRNTVSAFLLHFQQSGEFSSGITEEAVWSYFYDSDADRLVRGRGCSYAVRSFLKWAGGRPGGDCYVRVLPMVPAVKQPRKPSDCMTEGEDSRLLSYILGEGCSLSLRDAAIVTVARFCGLRACDIASLRMDDVDLEHSRLKVRQRKTGVPLVQTLRPVVGRSTSGRLLPTGRKNAIIRYVMRERPESGLPEVFLVDDREVRPLSPSSVTEVCNKAYRLAGIRQDGHRRGCHLLRHRFAQSLIDGGACDAAAMRLLGHTSPSSLDVYLETDERRLRECALSISDFAIGKEVLA